MRIPGFSNLYRADSIGVSLGASSVAAAGSRIIGLARGIALAWLIPQAEFGLYGVALLIINVLLPVCSGGLYEGVMRYAPFHESAGTLRRFIIRSGVLVAGIAVLSTAVLAMFTGPVSWALFSTAAGTQADLAASLGDASLYGLTRASLACVVSLAAYQVFLGLLKGLRMFRALGAVELTTACLFTLLALLGASTGFVSAQALIVTYALSCVVVVVLFGPGFLIATWRRHEPSDGGIDGTSRRPSSGLLTYSLWAAGTAVLWHALSYYPMWYLLKVSDNETVGTFHAVRLITQFIQIGAVMLTAVVASHVTRLWEHDGREIAAERLNLLTRATLVLLVFGATILAFLRPVALWLFPSAFATGEIAYNPLLLFFLLVGVVGLIAVRFNLLEKPRLVCLAWLVGAVVNIVVSYLLVPSGDVTVDPANATALMAAAWASVAGVSATLAMCLVLVSVKGLPPDLASSVLIVAAFGVGGGWIGGLLATVAVILLLTGTSVLLGKAEWTELRRCFGQTSNQ